MISTNIQAACQILNNNDLVAIPTETVYGLAANALNEKAVLKIFTLKKRPAYNPLIIHIGAIEDLDKWAKNIPEKAYLLAKTFWPGPLTLVLEKKAMVPNIITAGKNTVGIRMPNHPVTLSLLKQLNFPLAAPSANPFMSISPTTAVHVEDYFGHKLPMILEGGPCEKGIESTIIGFENGTPLLYRLGSISEETIEKICGPLGRVKTISKTPVAPGMLAKHYAPKTPVILTEKIGAHILDTYKGKKIGLLFYENTTYNNTAYTIEILSKNGSLEEAAKNLYATLHRLDVMKLDLIIIQKSPNHGLGKSINDRLERAAKK